MKMIQFNTFSTSFSNGIKLQLDSKNHAVTLIITNLPAHRSFDEIGIFVTDEFGRAHNREYLKRNTEINYSLPLLNVGAYYLNVYRLISKSFTGSEYSSYLHEQDIAIEIQNDRSVRFKNSPVYRHNFDVINNFRSDKSFLQDCLKPTSASQSDDRRIKDLSTSITKSHLFTINKIRAIHDWIAGNIYYDMDSLKNGNYKNIDSSAVGTLLTRKSVCQGYSDLSVAMLRAAGIPAMGLSCFALGLSTDKRWTPQILGSSETNHRITAAYCDQRWVIMDITWDSDNQYINDVFTKKTGLGTHYKYFDVTTPFLSSSHRLASDF